LEDSLEELVSPPVVPNHEVAGAEVVVRGHAEEQVIDPLGDPQRTLSEGGRIRCVPGYPRMLGQVRGDPAETVRVVQRRGQTFGIAEMLEAPLETAEGPQRVSESEANVDGLLEGLAGLGTMA